MDMVFCDRVDIDPLAGGPARYLSNTIYIEYLCLVLYKTKKLITFVNTKVEQVTVIIIVRLSFIKFWKIKNIGTF